MDSGSTRHWKLCTRCGAHNAPEASYCLDCGNAFAATPATPEGTAAPTPRPSARRVTANTRSRVILALAAALSVCVTCVMLSALVSALGGGRATPTASRAELAPTSTTTNDAPTPTGAVALAAIPATAPPATATPAPTGTAPLPISTPSPTASPAPSATATPAPTDTPAPTAPARQVPPTATPARPTVLDPDGQCQLALPAGFTEETPGGGYFPAIDRSGFAALDSPDTRNGAISFDTAAQIVITTMKSALQNYQQTDLNKGQGTIQVQFTANSEGRAGRGTIYFRQFGNTVCAATFYLLQGSALPYDATLQGLTTSLRAVTNPRPRPTPTPTPQPTPTPTPAPRAPAPAPAPPPSSAASSWNGLPLYPGARLFEDKGDTATFYTSDSEATVDAWYRRELRAQGYTFVMDYPNQGYVFHVYQRGSTIMLYATTRASGLTAIALGVVR